MPPTDPITHWIDQLKAGDGAAVEPLWDRYFHQLLQLARQRLRTAPRRAADEDDVALSAFASFCRAAEQGRLPKLTDRDSLWTHLFVYTIRKACDLLKRERAQKRGGGQVVNASALDGPDGDSFLGKILSAGPTPEAVARFEEDYRALFDRLEKPDHRAVAQWKLEGYTNDEIAAKLKCDRRSVERKLNAIRTLWGKPDEDQP